MNFSIFLTNLIYFLASGKVNPPPPDVQYKMLEKLKVDDKQKKKFLNLAAEGRGEIPADIAKLITDNPRQLEKIRTTLTELLVKQR